MHFWVIHKKVGQKLGPFNEKAIVDFCLSNKDSIKNYYFSEGNQKDILEWETFAMKYGELFESKVKEREEKEDIELKNAVIKNTKKSFMPFIIVFLLLLLAGGAAFYYFFVLNNQNQNKESIPQNIEQKEVVKEEKKIYPIKREEKPEDSSFTGIIPDDNTLKELWKKSNQKLPKSLAPEAIKTVMDNNLPKLANCFDERVKAGDKELKGEINMKIRIAGNGKVVDVLFLSDKYKSTLFGDCIINFLKSENFPMFEAKEQVFTYYWNL